MTSNVKLLPLPELASERVFGAKWDDFDMQDYARANVAHATAARDAEIAQLEKANEQLHAHGERMHAEMEALRKERDRAVEAGEIMARHLDTLEPRAERLAEALRLISAPQRSDGTWNRDRESCRQIAENALRDHDQEGKDG